MLGQKRRQCSAVTRIVFLTLDIIVQLEFLHEHKSNKSTQFKKLLKPKNYITLPHKYKQLK